MTRTVTILKKIESPHSRIESELKPVELRMNSEH